MDTVMLGPVASAIQNTWMEFWRCRDFPARQRLVEHYLGFARMLAARLYASRVDRGLEFCDFLQFAREGLLQAIDRYEAGHGAKFESYAVTRINGAILDGIQSYSDVQQQIVTRRRMLAERVAAVSLGATPGDDADALFSQLADIARDLAVGFALEQPGVYMADEPSYPDNAYSGAELRQVKHRLRGLLEELSERQRQVLSYHYLQQLPFEEIAQMLDLSRGRVSQLHRDGLANLRKRLTPDDAMNFSF